MPDINVGVIINVILAGLGLASAMGFIGMGVWYIKVKPEIENSKKALEKKRGIDECILLRQACQPLLLEQLKGLSFKIDELREGQKIFSHKMDKLMSKNGFSI